MGLNVVPARSAYSSISGTTTGGNYKTGGGLAVGATNPTKITFGDGRVPNPTGATRAIDTDALNQTPRPAPYGTVPGGPGWAESGGYQNVQGGTNNISRPAPVDPYAQWGGRAAYDAKVDQFNKSKNIVFTSAADAAKNAGLQRKSSILDLIQQRQSGQRNLDQSRVNNELSRQQGRQSIMDMVGRGIRSGNVTLANRNASDSSAADAIERAYQQIGQQQNTDLGTEAALAEQDIALQQQDFEDEIGTNLRKLEESKTLVANNIVSDAESKLAQIDALMAESSLPDRIEMQSEKNRIKQQAMQELAQYDAMLNAEMAKINPMARNQVQARAGELRSQGAAAPSLLGESRGPSIQSRPTQGFQGNLPIFTLPNRREERA